MIGFGVVKGEVRSWKIQFQQILLAGQMQRSGFVGGTLALLQHIGEVFAGEGLISKGVLHGPSHRIDPIKLA